MGDKMGGAEVVIDSKGKSHYVIYQSYGTTCGPACAAMLQYYYGNHECKKDADLRIKDLVGWKEGAGVGRGDLAQGINDNLKIPCELLVLDPKSSFFFDFLGTFVTEKTPAIVEVDHSWMNLSHFALCRRIDPDGTGIFLDPVSGLQETKKTGLPFFRFNPMGKFNFSGGVIVSFLQPS
jgi:hypothetical protein